MNSKLIFLASIIVSVFSQFSRCNEIMRECTILETRADNSGNFANQTSFELALKNKNDLMSHLNYSVINNISSWYHNYYIGIWKTIFGLLTVQGLLYRPTERLSRIWQYAFVLAIMSFSDEIKSYENREFQ